MPDEDSIERTEFQKLMKKFKIKLENELLDQLLKTFTSSNGEPNPRVIKDMWKKYYPDSKLPIKKSKTKGKKKKEQKEATEKSVKEKLNEEEDGVCDCEFSSEDETFGNDTETDKNEQVENITITTQDAIPSEDMKTITSQSTLKSEAN